MAGGLCDKCSLCGTESSGLPAPAPQQEVHAACTEQGSGIVRVCVAGNAEAQPSSETPARGPFEQDGTAPRRLSKGPGTPRACVPRCACQVSLLLLLTLSLLFLLFFLSLGSGSFPPCFSVCCPVYLSPSLLHTGGAAELTQDMVITHAALKPLSGSTQEVVT